MQRRFLRAILTGAVLAGLSGCGGCFTKDGTGEKFGPPGADLPRDLKPLPEPPTLDLAQSEAGAKGELSVVATRPQGEIRGEVRPTITFSRPVKSLEALEASVGPQGQAQSSAAVPVARIEPPLEGEWKWLGSASVELVPKGLVPYSTAYQVTVLKGLKALDGSVLPADFTFSFNTPRVALQEVWPAREFRWLQPNATLKLLFNQPVREADLLAALTVTVGGDSTPWKLRVVSRTSIAEERRKAEEKARAEGKAESRQQPMSAQERGFENQQTRYELAFEKPLPLGQEVVLRLAPTLKGEQGTLTMDREETVTWRVYGPLTFSRAAMCLDAGRCPYGPLILFTSNEVALESLKSRLKIEPAVELDWERASAFAPPSYRQDGYGPYVALSGKFKPGTSYRVKVEAGVEDIFKQKLEKAFEQEVRTEDLLPQLTVGSALGLIETASGPRLPIDVVNLKKLEVSLWKLSLPELAKHLAPAHYKGEKSGLGRAADVQESVELSYPWNTERTHPVDLTRALGGKPSGAVLAQLSSPNLIHPPPAGYRTVTQVTDLAVHTKLAPKKSLAWVTRLSNGAPVDGAEISIYDATGNKRWSGRTDAHGFCDFPGAVELNLPVRYEWESPFVMVAAEKDGDQSATASSWSSGLEPYEFGIASGWEGATPHSNGYVFTDRGVYRPGDKVFIKGVARYRQLGKLLAPKEGSTLTLRIIDSKGEPSANQNVQISRFGTFHAEFEIPKEAPTGGFTVAVAGTAPSGSLEFQTGFAVEEYRAPQFKVEVQVEKPGLVAGESLGASVLARYLFGGAMSGAKVRWSVQRETTTFVPPQPNGFTFAQETWWWDDQSPQPVSGFFASGEGVADVTGALAVKAGTVEAPGEKSYQYTFEAEVEDVNRQRVAARREVKVHPARYYVGLRAPGGFGKAGEELALQALVVDQSGARTKGRPVEVTVSRREWKSVKKKDAAGGYTTLSEPVETQVHACKLVSEADAVACRYKPDAAGFFVVRAKVTDEQERRHSASLGLYVSGPGFVAWQRNDTDRLDLVADKDSYDVGEVAKVLVKSPYPEASALVTLEREGVLERRQVKFVGSVTTLDIPITEEMVPNVYVGVLMARPRVSQGGIETGDDPGRPAVRVGLVKLKVERKTKRLAVKVTTDRPQYRPGEEVSVAVEVRDFASKATPAEVTVYAVDEAVLSLTGYTTPDPLDSIYSERPLSVRLGEPLVHLVRRRSYEEKGKTQGGGGGGGEGRGLRTRFVTTPLFQPALVVGADGKGSLKFKLPDNLTTFRIMAVAVSADDRYGSGESSVQVNKPLLLQPALPRFARVGDQFEAGVVVHRYAAVGDEKPAEVTVLASAKGARLEGPAERRVVVGPGSPKEVRFTFVATEKGTATFQFRGKRGNDDDGVEQKLPVELPTAPEVVAVYGDTVDQRVEGLVPPKDVWPGVGGLDLTLTSTAVGSFQQGFRQLIDYPYGCLEQQASRLVPFVALRELSGKFGVPWPSADPKKQAALGEQAAWLGQFLGGTLDATGESDPDAVIRATVSSIGRLQDDDGGFRYWADALCPSSWGSAYATLALQRAKEVGFEVGADRLARAERFLGRVAGGECPRCELACSDETRVFATYVLARMKKPRPSFYGELYERREKLPLFSRALLADAMFIGGGDRSRAKTLLQELLNHAKESPKGIHFEEVHGQTYATLWHSDARTTGAVLRTLVDISPDHPFVSKMARYLTDVRKGDGQWRSTQEAAFSLMALTEVVRVKEKETPDFKAKVQLGDVELLSQGFKGRSMNVVAKSVGIDELLAKAKGAEQKLSFQKSGPGVLYYSAALKYAPKEPPMNKLDQGLFVQRWFEPYSGGGQSLRFYAGDLVRVRLRVGTNQERHWVAFEVPLPAGLEPVNTALATTARQASSPDEESSEGYDYEGGEDQEGGSAYEDEEGDNPWAYRFWSPFNHMEQRDNRVVLFADHLPPGVHVATFVARATTPGTFLLKPARGELMYEPEVFGRSEGGRFEVVVPPQVSAK